MYITLASQVTDIIGRPNGARISRPPWGWDAYAGQRRQPYAATAGRTHAPASVLRSELPYKRPTTWHAAR